MRECYLLLRQCSAYSFNDIILGLYKSEKKAINAKKQYISEVSAHDDYANQAYHTVDLETDVVIEQVNVHLTGEKQVYILIEHDEGFGQVITKPIFFHNSFEAVKDKCKELGQASYMWDALMLGDPARFHNDQKFINL